MKRAKAQGWGKVAALIAGLAVLLQATLVPPARAQVLEVCTAHGVEKVLVKGEAGPAMPGDCGHCGQCVLVAAVDVPAVRIDAPVRYAVAAVTVPADRVAAGHAARPPPRPPGQAPPI